VASPPCQLLGAGGASEPPWASPPTQRGSRPTTEAGSLGLRLYGVEGRRLTALQQEVSAQRSPHRTSTFPRIRRSNQPCLSCPFRTLHDGPPDDTLCRVPVLARVAPYQRLFLQVLILWYPSDSCDVRALPGFPHSVRMYPHCGR